MVDAGPSDGGESSSRSNSRAKLSRVGLPQGWYQGVDETRNRPYYFNKHTRRSTWTRPPSEVSNGVNDTKINAKGSSGGPRKVWLEVHSPEHKRTYFFNRDTKESTWIPPASFSINGGGASNDKTDLPGSVSVAASSYLSANLREDASLRAAWGEIKQAQREMRREREEYTYQLRHEWKELQAQIAQLRELSIVSDANTASDSGPVPTPSIFGIAVPVFAPFAEVNSYASAVDRKAALKPKRAPTAAAENGQTESDFAPLTPSNTKTAPLAPVSSNTSTSLPKRSSDESKTDGTDAYTSGLLSELEEYAESLMKRRESVHKFMSSIEDGTGTADGTCSRSENLLAHEESKHIVHAARAARRQIRGNLNVDGKEINEDDESDSGEEDDTDFDPNEYVAQVLASDFATERETTTAEGSVTTKQRKLRHFWSSKSSQIPTAEIVSLAQAEIAEVDDGLAAVRAEAEAVRKAQNEFEQLEEGCYYRLLNVLPGASNKDIKRGYHKAMLKWHPDKFKIAIEKEAKKANEKAIQVSMAHETLMDPWKRYLYDTMGLKQYLHHINIVQQTINYFNTAQVRIKKHPRTQRGPFRFFDRQFIRNRWIWLAMDNTTINVAQSISHEPSQAHLGKIRQLPVKDINNISVGMKSPGLQNTGIKSREGRYFSIWITDNISIDLEAQDMTRRNFLASRLEMLVIYLQQNKEWFQKVAQRHKNKRYKCRPIRKPPPVSHADEY